MTYNRFIKIFIAGVTGMILLAGCQGKGDRTGREYAPNMYHSVAYEPLSQVTDEDAGAWVNSLDARTGEYFNSNKYNPYRMTMRMPPPNTVKRNKYGWLPYRSKNVPKDSVPLISAGLKNPFDSTVALLAEGKYLFDVYCKHCHGAKGEGDGTVATGIMADKTEKGMVAGVANLKGPAYLSITEGHIFHVITYGAGLMQPHGSQVNPDERWKIAKYVKALQKQ